jgi:hypothetical protein
MVLLLTLITRTRVEQALANRLGRIFRPLLITVVIIAASLSWRDRIGDGNLSPTAASRVLV